MNTIKHTLRILLACSLGACGDHSGAGSSGLDNVPTLAGFVDEVLRAAPLRAATDLEPGVCAREVRYTRTWLARLLRPEVLDAVRDGDFHCVSLAGPQSDDAVVAAWKSGGVSIEVIDTRVLIVAVDGGAPDGNVARSFESVVDYGRHAGAGRSTFRILEGGTDQVGTVEIDRRGARGWFSEPIVWTRVGTRVAFVVDKTIEPPPSKVPYSPDRAPEFVDGIPPNDPRRYLRFNASNRESLARERYSATRRDSGPEASKGDHGRRVGR